MTIIFNSDQGIVYKESTGLLTNANRSSAVLGGNAYQIGSSTPNEDIRLYADASLGGLVSILSLIEIIFIVRIKRKKKLYEMLLLSIAFSDLLFGLLNIAIPVSNLTNGMSNTTFTEAIHVVYYNFILASIIHLCWITVDHVWTVISPIKRNIYVTRTKTYVSLVITWIISTFAPLLIFFYHGMLKKDHFLTKYFTASHSLRFNQGNVFDRIENKVLAGLIFTADGMFVTFYGYTIYKMYNKKEKDMKNEFEKQVHKTASVVCIVTASLFAICTMPYALGAFNVEQFFPWTHELVILNSVAHPIVYFVFRGWCEKRWKHYEKQANRQDRLYSVTNSITRHGRRSMPYRDSSMESSSEM